jgi:hypothetical protein
MDRTYSTIWRAKGLTDDAETLDDMIAALEAAIAELRTLRDAGVRLASSVEDDYAYLMTTDPGVAERYGFEEDVEDDTDFDVEPPGGNGLHPA